MGLSPGTRLGAYEIVGLLGAGGMGEVYRARDTRLDRHVAIKALPDDVRTDTERVARFEREAKVLATLNHPNIATIHGLEEADSEQFIVMELVDGDTLADRIARGPIPLDEALPLARQIAEALEAAHEQGIIHRDLKPANIKLRPDGTVKVLDFGLAKVFAGDIAAQSRVDLTHSPTLTSPIGVTAVGVLLGTAAYMAPEQAKGLPADHRADIFSFGVVLYEMLTGCNPFQGETATDIIASIVAREPDLAALPGDLHPKLVDVVRRCLVKHPKKRWQAIGDVRIELEQPPTELRTSDDVTPVIQRPTWRWVLAAVTSSLFVGILSGGAAWMLKPSTPDRDVTRFTIPLDDGQVFTNPGRNLVAISPDGTRLAFVANQRLYLRLLSEQHAQAVSGTEQPDGGVMSPVFSPDGQWLAFYTGVGSGTGVLKKIAVAGGAAITLCPASSPFGISWEQDTILFGQDSQGIMRVSSNGGQPEIVVKAGADEQIRFPSILPGGENILYTVMQTGGPSGVDTSQIVVQPLKGNERKVLIAGGSDGRYVASGHLVYAQRGVLFAVPFDARRLEIRTTGIPVVEGVRRGGGAYNAAAQFSVSKTGSLTYLPGPIAAPDERQDIAVINRTTGTAVPLKLTAQPYRHTRFSPDGKSVAFSADDGKETNVWVYDLSGRAAARRLTFGGNNRYPIWTSDGQRLVFQSDRDKDLTLFWQRADTSGMAERLTTPEPGTAHVPESWSRDGRYLLYSASTAGQTTLWWFSATDRKTERFQGIESPNPLGAVFSPDGRWVAYSVSEKPGLGSDYIYVQPFPPTGARYLIGRGHHPMWSPDGQELIYEPGQNVLSAVKVQTTPTFQFGNPVALAGGSFGSTAPTLVRNRDTAPDGTEFIAPVVPELIEIPSEIRVVKNWVEELRRLMQAN